MTGQALHHHTRAPAGRHHRHPWRRHLGRVLAVGFLLLVGWLVIDRARTIDWAAVRDALAAYPRTQLAGALALAALSHFIYACYELVSRRYVRHKLPTHKVLGVGLVSYAFNLNLGSIVGGFGFRWRLYSKLGLRQGQIARIVAMSVVTNWSGYLLLAGIVLALRLLALPPQWTWGSDALQLLGLAMIAVAVFYLVACATARRRELKFRSHHFKLPTGRMAAVQIALSSANWAVIGAILWVLLPAGPSYGVVLATLLVAGIAGVITHVPAGLGVIEAVFVATLAGPVAEPALIAALLVYRALYYLLPLAIAAALHFAFEASARRKR